MVMERFSTSHYVWTRHFLSVGAGPVKTWISPLCPFLYLVLLSCNIRMHFKTISSHHIRILLLHGCRPIPLEGSWGGEWSLEQIYTLCTHHIASCRVPLNLFTFPVCNIIFPVRADDLWLKKSCLHGLPNRVWLWRTDLGQSAGCVLESSCCHAMGNSFGSDVPSEARCVDTAFCFAN